MVAYRLEGQSYLIGDLLVATPLSHHDQEFQLPLAQVRKPSGRNGRPGRRKETQDALGDAWTKNGLAPLTTARIARKNSA